MSQKPKISIITLSLLDNYGSVLQTFATQYLLTSMRYDVSIIHYKPEYVSLPLYKRVITSIRENGFKKTLSISVKIVHTNISNRHHIIRQKHIFSEFRSKYIQFTDNTYNERILETNPPESDIYIAGSDNIWGVNSEGKVSQTKKPYFLTFVPQNKLKLSYATSMGIPKIHPTQKDEFRKYLENIDYISVRGESTAKFLHELTGRNIANTLDPTLLLTKEEWAEKFNLTSQKDKPYILVYVIYKFPRKSEIYKFSKILAKIIGMNIKYIGYHYRHGLPQYNDVEVEDFLKLFMNASYVITNSFHGTLFSIIFRKTFYTFTPWGYPTRITDMLSSISLQDRYIQTSDEALSLPQEIDYSIPEQKLNELRDYSLIWLKNALESEKRTIQNDNSN